MVDYRKLCEIFPTKVKNAVLRALTSARIKPTEIHIVRGSGSCVRFLGGRIYLGITVSDGDISDMLSLITGGALYAYRHTIKDGYVPLACGVRVGICGQARYERGELVGVSEVTSLLVRLPSYECEFIDELISAFFEAERGMLIFAPACGGKTTALRALIKGLAQRENPPRISVIDERCEIGNEDFLKLDVDVFRGYEKGEGMRIAMHVMSPEIIAIDEIGGACRSRDIIETVFGGVRFIATAHGKALSDLEKRENLAPFFEAGAFDRFARIFNTDGRFGCEILK